MLRCGAETPSRMALPAAQQGMWVGCSGCTAMIPPPAPPLCTPLGPAAQLPGTLHRGWTGTEIVQSAPSSHAHATRGVVPASRGFDCRASTQPPIPLSSPPPVNGTTRSVTVRNAAPDEILRQAILLRSSTGRKASLQVKRRQVSKNPSIQGMWTSELQDRIKGVRAAQ